MESVLREIGLTDGEIRVYLALLELGQTTTGKITEKSQISGSKVYEVLDRLINKGMASVVIVRGTKHFQASPPEKILNYLDEKESRLKDEKEKIKEILPQLKLKQKFGEKRSAAIVLKGFEGSKTAYNDLLNTMKRGEEWLSMGLSSQPKRWENYFNKFQEIRAKKGIILKHLLNEQYQVIFETRKNLPCTHFRFLPKETQMPASVDIYQNKVIISVLEEEGTTVMIEDEKIAESFRKYFEMLWKTAGK